MEPVKDKWATAFDAHKALPNSIDRSASAVTKLNTPSGIPALLARTANARADNGVCSAGLITIVQPAAIAGATLRVIIAIGKFQGVIATQTPIGCLRTIMRLSVQVDAKTEPMTRLPSSANHSIKELPYVISPFASAKGLPCSITISFAKSSVCSVMRSNHLRIMAERSFAVRFFQGSKAACAASIAACASLVVILTT